eukprot:gnl/Dysnectes_brevis/5141_a7259_368.p1 GENE.gnl/Dysnectes_brevis/5141_a7259_368~~gnl/Dysnectes_brevis/5141_a7259_368.p1  ORF type:complete len:767 (+),score=289.72 gnl/Dysnectes_brevis/5141_a7259_368:66-2366(+)
MTDGGDTDDIYSSFESTFQHSRGANVFAAAKAAPVPRLLQTAAREQSRPMTAVVAAGFSSTVKSSSLTELSHLSGMPTEKQDDSPEAQAKRLEHQVTKLIGEAACSSAAADHSTALSKVREAVRREKQLRRIREAHNQRDQISPDLTVCVWFHLGMAQQAAGQLDAALSTYERIVRSVHQQTAASVRLNMGAIHFHQGKYASAIKMYRMALDQTPPEFSSLRQRIVRALSLATVKLGRWQDAVDAIEDTSDEKTGFDALFTLVICHYALGNQRAMLAVFGRLLDASVLSSPDAQHGGGILDFPEEDAPAPGLLDDEQQGEEDRLLLDDLARSQASQARSQRVRILQASRLLAPVVCWSEAAGYDRISEVLERRGHSDLSRQLQMSKALSLLRRREFEAAAAALEAIGRTDGVDGSQEDVRGVSTNMSFIAFVQGDTEAALMHAKRGVEADRFDSYALVNLGNAYAHQGNWTKAMEHYREASRVNADCLQALYNLGLAHTRTNGWEEALGFFQRCGVRLPRCREVLYMIGECQFKLDRVPDAISSFHQLLTLIPTDPGVLSRLGQLHAAQGDHSQAFHHFKEADRLLPTNLNVLSWLGAHYVRSELFEQGRACFLRAAEADPLNPRWRLMDAACLRKTGQLQEATDAYQAVLKDFPDNEEALSFLAKLLAKRGLPDEAATYTARLQAVRKAARGNPGSGLSSTIQDGKGQQTHEPGTQTLPSRSRQRGAGRGHSNRRSRSHLPAKPATPQEESDDPFGDEDVAGELL